MIVGSATARSKPVQVLLSTAEAAPLKDKLVELRKEAGIGIAHDEDTLLKILGLQLGILSFAATMLFKSDFETKYPKMLFGVFVVLTAVLGLCYMHVYKAYLGSYIFAVRLESVAYPLPLRPYQNVYLELAEPTPSAFFRPFLSLTDTFYLVSFIPVYVMVSVVVAFGRRLEISSDVCASLSLFSAAWSFAYLLPVFRAIDAYGG
ncbi:MAG TPA: hypothetical protein VGO11_20010 [Chthoniobacteraceae bacterium]|jgi:hypothetical protein|nr:hypothetical protein [Chthoniobacteraceae bacterium]